MTMARKQEVDLKLEEVHKSHVVDMVLDKAKTTPPAAERPTKPVTYCKELTNLAARSARTMCAKPIRLPALRTESS